MATAKQSTKTAAPSRKTRAKRAPDAIALLRADHREVADLLAQFESSRAAKRKQELAQRICKELTIHAQIEEEIFYPAFSAATRDKELIPEATVEHQTLKDLIAQVMSETPEDKLFDAKVKVLGEYVKHHVKEEQNEMFPKARSSKLDLAELGDRLRARKQELMQAQP